MTLGKLIAIILLINLGHQVSAEAMGDKAKVIVDRGRNACEREGGTFLMEPSAQTVYEFPSRSTTEGFTVVNENYFHCSSAASLYGGSAGGRVHIITNSDYLYGYSRELEVTTAFDEMPIILLGLHGMSCGVAGYKPCIRVVTISEGKLITLE